MALDTSLNRVLRLTVTVVTGTHSKLLAGICLGLILSNDCCELDYSQLI